MASFFRFIRLGLLVALLLGVALHLTVRDRWPVLATVYYSLPLPIVTLGWLGWALAPGIRKARAIVGGLAALACGFWWHSASFHPAAAAPSAPSAGGQIRVLFWNLYHARLPHEELARILEEEKPAFAGFVEMGHGSGDPHPLVDPLPPGYQALKSPHGTALIVRGTVTVNRVVLLPSGSKFVEFGAMMDGQAWRIFVVDGVSSPIRSRRDLLTEVLASARDLPRTLVMGDFNTPRGSAYFDAWREEFHHAYDMAGEGWSETWPSFFPVLAIDHLWVSRDLMPVQAGKLWRSSSDHAALIVTLDMPPPAPAPAR